MNMTNSYLPFGPDPFEAMELWTESQVLPPPSLIDPLVQMLGRLETSIELSSKGPGVNSDPLAAMLDAVEASVFPILPARFDEPMG